MLDFILEVLAQGLAYGILAIGVTLTYKILDFPDMTVDGSFPLGAVIAAVSITHGVPPLAAMALAMVGGVAAGYLAGFLHVYLKISNLLSGILVMTGLYSVNLMVGLNKSNIPVFKFSTIFTIGTWIEMFPVGLRPVIQQFYPIALLLSLVLIVKFSLDWFLGTKLGFLIRITGDNPQLVIALGEDIGRTKILGLTMSNAIAALAGSIIMQLLRYYDITMGSGVVVIGLASVVLGTTVFSWIKSFKITTVVVLGSIFYRLCISFALAMNLPPSNLKLVTVILFVSAIVINNGSLKKWMAQLGGKDHVKTDTH